MGHRSCQVSLDVDVGVVGDVEHDLGDRAAGELELRSGVETRHGVGAVVADAQTLATQREVAHHGSDLFLGHQLIVDVELERPDALAVLTDLLFRELDADDVLAGRRRRRRDPVLGRDAEEVVDVRDLAVLDQQCVTAEP